MADSIFTKIINGEVPSYKIYEDDRTFAFLDIHPKVPGHILVVPKNQIDEFQDLPDNDYLALMQTVKRVAKRLKDVLNADRIGLQVVGMDVPHVHIHVFPFSNMNQYHAKAYKASDKALADMAKRLAF